MKRKEIPMRDPCSPDENEESKESNCRSNNEHGERVAIKKIVFWIQYLKDHRLSKETCIRASLKDCTFRSGKLAVSMLVSSSLHRRLPVV